VIEVVIELDGDVSTVSEDVFTIEKDRDADCVGSMVVELEKITEEVAEAEEDEDPVVVGS
jgi:hypothetical protein